MKAGDSFQAKPVAQGDLSRTPFTHLIVYIQREHLSGTLVLDRGGVEAKILFRTGRAVAARLFSGSSSLHDGMLELCELAEGPFGFWEGDHMGEGPGVLRGTVDALSFSGDAVRRHVRDGVIAGVLDRYRGVALRAVPEVDPRKFNLRGAEAHYVERLREQPAIPDQIEDSGLVSPEQARRLLYLLLITGHIVAEATDTSNRSGVRAVVAPQGMGTSVFPPRAGEHGTMSSRPPGASPSSPVPGTAHYGSSHPPDRSAGSGGPSSSIPAWKQLASWRSGGASSLPPARVPPASMAPPPVESLDDAGKLRRAEQLIERRSYTEASHILDDLLMRMPSNPDHHALRGYMLAQQFTGDHPPRALIEAIENALRLNKNHPRGLYLKGLVLKRMGRDNDALRLFQRVLEADPHHLEAARELRLAKMRRDK